MVLEGGGGGAGAQDKLHLDHQAYGGTGGAGAVVNGFGSIW
jgi:hypothetical protein